MEFTISGASVVCCPHDRPKREVRDPEQVIYLGHAAGHAFDPRKHLLQLCPCCDNLFVTDNDTPRLCAPCTGDPVHVLGGPLPEPVGRI